MAGSIRNHLGLTRFWLHFWIQLCASTCMLLFGYDQGVFGGILTIESFVKRFGIESDGKRKSFIVASYDLGCFLGAIITIKLGERIGRKRSIFTGTAVMMTGACFQFLAPGYGLMITGRIIAGLGNGMNTVTAPVWATETSKTASRGKSGLTLMVINIGGLMISCWTTYGTSRYLTEFSWRFPLGFQVVFGSVILLTVFWLPESPRWLIAKGHNDKARRVMAALEGTADGKKLDADFEEIRDSIAWEQSPDVRHNTKPLFRMVLGVGAQGMQQLTGINIICYYLPYVLTKSVGLDPDRARLLASVNAVTYLLSTLIGLQFIERWGRRRLMILGALGQFCCWLAITVLLSAAEKQHLHVSLTEPDPLQPIAHSSKEKAFGSASVAFFFVFNIFFGAGWQGVSWLYPTEINSTQNRITGMGSGVAVNWAINFLVVFITPIAIESIGARFYIIWTVFNAAIMPIVWLFYPETAGRSLEAIDRMFETNPTMLVGLQPNMTSLRPARMVSEDDADEESTAGHLDDEQRMPSENKIVPAGEPSGACIPLETQQAKAP